MTDKEFRARGVGRSDGISRLEALSSPLHTHTRLNLYGDAALQKSSSIGRFTSKLLPDSSNVASPFLQMSWIIWTEPHFSFFAFAG